MPLTELEQNVNAELDDNPALETSSPDDVFEGGHVEGSDSAASYDDDPTKLTNSHHRMSERNAMMH